MPVRPPALDDRSFDDLVDEVLARIPAHTPEYTNPRLGDPGRTLIELFAWLTDALLYRANLIPERQRLAFLRLLGVQMRPAVAARGLVAVSIDDEKATSAAYLQPVATLTGPATFETLDYVTALPVVGEAYYKRRLKRAEKSRLDDVVQGLQDLYQLKQAATPYATTPVFAKGAADLNGFDFIESTVDRCLWIALLAPKPENRDAIKETLGKNPAGGQQLINIGVVPSIKAPALFEEISSPARIPFVWEISTGKELRDEPEYLTLDVISDTTFGLTRRGIMRLALPTGDRIGALTNDVRESFKAGLGSRPPRLDDPDKAKRLIAWLRLRPTKLLRHLPLSWVGINAVEIDQRQTITSRVVGQSDGSSDQEMRLPGQSIDPATIQIQVEETGRGYQSWQQIDDLALAGRDDTVFKLDSEAGAISFGNGIQGRLPESGMRVRVARMRAGGGRAGNLPPGSLTDIKARDLNGNPVAIKLKVLQSLATDGGEDAETLAEAERRIPALFRHRDRAVTEEDYKRLAFDTPGIRMGRVVVLPRFKPQQRRSDVPGVVSVMALPAKATIGAPNPRPDRPFIEAVHNYLSARRPLTTELYVIGCEYVSLGLCVGLTIRDGFARDEVVNAVRESLKLFLWPLAPGGTEGEGWTLGRAVRDRELEVVVARVPGVSTVSGINLFEDRNGEWRMLTHSDACAPVEMPLKQWQLPELISVSVMVDDGPCTDLRGAPNPFGDQAGIPVPVVPEVC